MSCHKSKYSCPNRCNRHQGAIGWDARSAGRVPAGLLDAGTAVGTDLPVCIQRPVTGGADVSHLRVADGAHDEVAIDGRTALGADTVV